MVFYDFIGGLESSQFVAFLTSTLYHGTTAFGQPATLHASASVSDLVLDVVAVFGAKQPILPYVDCPLFLLLWFIVSGNGQRCCQTPDQERDLSAKVSKPRLRR